MTHAYQHFFETLKLTATIHFAPPVGGPSFHLSPPPITWSPRNPNREERISIWDEYLSFKHKAMQDLAENTKCVLCDCTISADQKLHLVIFRKGIPPHHFDPMPKDTLPDVLNRMVKDFFEKQNAR